MAEKLMNIGKSRNFLSDKTEAATRDLRAERLLEAAAIDRATTTLRKVQRLTNALKEQVSLGVHIYGVNVSAVPGYAVGRSSWTPSHFISGYRSNLVDDPRDK